MKTKESLLQLLFTQKYKSMLCAYIIKCTPSNTYNWPDVGSILVNVGPTKSAKGQYRANCMCYLGRLRVRDRKTKQTGIHLNLIDIVMFSFQVSQL